MGEQEIWQVYNREYIADLQDLYGRLIQTSLTRRVNFFHKYIYPEADILYLSNIVPYFRENVPLGVDLAETLGEKFDRTLENLFDEQIEKYDQDTTRLEADSKIAKRWDIF